MTKEAAGQELIDRALRRLLKVEVRAKKEAALDQPLDGDGAGETEPDA